MGRYIVRRLLSAIPTLLVVSFVIFIILDLAPNDPTARSVARDLELSDAELEDLARSVLSVSVVAHKPNGA